MKITVDHSNADTKILVVVSAEYLGDYTVRIEFNDGTVNSVDFKPFLTSSVNPSIRKYLDEKLFSEFRIVDGNLNWYDYDLIFPVWDLYEGKIT